MEIRLLNEHEIQWAVNTVTETFETCVRPCCRTQEEVDWFYGYVNPEHLWREMSGGRLGLWGVFDEGQMCAVSAMQGNGHITILSVKQEYQFRRMGTQLLNAMYSYAAGVLHLERVTVLVSPVIKAAYFYRKGFLLLQPAGEQNPGVLLQRPLYQQPPFYGQYCSGVYGGAAASQGQGRWQPGPGVNAEGMQQVMPETDMGTAQPVFEPYPDQGLRQEGQPQTFQYNHVDGAVLQDTSCPSDMKREISYPTRRISTKLVLSVAAGSLGLCFLISVALAIVDIVTNV